ncbi:site-2 protease family protein [Azospirillum sp. sgz302134]
MAWVMVLATLLLMAVMMGAVMAVHEAGHYWAARMMGAPVDSVRIGVGPRLLRWTNAAGVEWRVAVVPVIGWVRLSESVQNTVPAWKRLVIVLAGPATSLVFGMGALVLHGVVAALLAGETAGAGGADGMRAAIALLAGMAHEFFDLLARVLTGAGLTTARPAPPVTGGPAVMQLAHMAGAMSLGIGAFNALPLPQFDGAQAVTLAVEWGVGPKVARVAGTALHWFGVAALLAAVVFWPFGPRP